MDNEDELLAEQLQDILYSDDNGISSEERGLALAVLGQAFEDIKRYSDKLSFPHQNAGVEALEWVRKCHRNQGGFGYYVGLIGRKPEDLRSIVNRWVSRGCAPLQIDSIDSMNSDSFNESKGD